VSKDAFHIPSLDGIRAASFGVVFLAHAGVETVPGLFGVTVFFFLSGFLITTLMRRESARTGTVSLKKFYLRRILRIFPPFYLILAGAVAMSVFGVSERGFETPAVVAQVAHYANYWIATHGFGGLPAGTGVYWSLAVEEHFYLVFPCLYLLLRRVTPSENHQVLVLLALCALALFWRCLLVYRLDAPQDRVSVASDTRFDSILFGCILALRENPVLDRSAIRDWVWKYVLFPAAMLVLLLTFLLRDPGFRESLRYTLQGIALVPLFVCAMRYPDWLPMKAFNYRPVAYVGVLSYTLYLVHQVVLASVATQAPEWSVGARGAVSLAISLLISFVLFQLIEKPCARLRKRLQA
jgi:peptidoglycan/LPS O-acetylase OafA/YrhL